MLSNSSTPSKDGFGLKNPKDSLRLSAYLRGLCVKRAISTQRTQRYAESGEAGIGKTSLVEQFVKKQKNECRVLWGGCDALFTPRPLGPIYDIARQIRGDLLTLLEEEASRLAIFSAVFDELESDPSTLLIIEDAHWADEATLDLLKFIGRRINKLNSVRAC